MRAVARRTRGAVWIGVGLALLLAAGCGGTEEAPELVAIPTRTPVPATEEAAGGAQNMATVVSLTGAIQDFLGVALDASPLDRLDLFREQVFTPQAECFDASSWPGWNPEQMVGSSGFNLVSMDLQRWSDLLASFPDEAAVSAIWDALAEAQAVLPLDEPFRVCLLPLPLPQFGFGPDATLSEDREPASDVQSQVLATGLSLVTVMCSGGDICLDRLSIESIYTYGALYQTVYSGKNALENTLLDRMIGSARAAYLVRQILPDAVFPWDGALTPEQEAALWEDIQEMLPVEYGDYPAGRTIDRILSGTSNTERYPTWGGLYLGDQIVRAYILRHPGVSLTALLTLDSEALLAESGYTPEALPSQETS